MNIINDLKRDINNIFNNLEVINELDNCMKKLDFMLTKSKQNLFQYRHNNEEQNRNFYRSEKEIFFNNNNNVNKIDNDEINNNEIIEQNQYIK